MPFSPAEYVFVARADLAETFENAIDCRGMFMTT